MVAPVRTNRVAFRRAVAASVAIHVALAVAVLVVSRSGGDAKTPRKPGLDTRADDVAIHTFLDTPTVTAQKPDVPAPSPSTPPSPSSPPPPSREGVEDSGGSRPLAGVVPQPLPAELLAIVRRRSAATSPVADTSVTPNVTPAGAVSANAIHGTLDPRQTIAYVLDCSGSMGEFDKLGRARTALVATLRGQPEGVRFQVVAYGSTARALLAAGLHPATAANVAAAEGKLLAASASGRSNHAVAVRVAATCRPDMILLLTDAEDLSLAQLRPALAEAGKSITVYVAKVTADGVGKPQELR